MRFVPASYRTPDNHKRRNIEQDAHDISATLKIHEKHGSWITADFSTPLYHRP